MWISDNTGTEVGMRESCHWYCHPSRRGPAARTWAIDPQGFGRTVAYDGQQISCKRKAGVTYVGIMTEFSL